MKFGPREKIVTAAAVLVILVVGWYFLYYGRKKSEIKTVQSEIVRLKNSISAENITPELIDSLKREVTKLEEKSKKEIALAVPKDSMEYVIRVLRDKIKAAHLEITDRINPNTEKLFGEAPKDTLELTTGITPIDIELFLKGNFYDLVAFLESFSTFPFLIRAWEISVDTGDDIYPMLVIRMKVFIFVS